MQLSQPLQNSAAQPLIKHEAAPVELHGMLYPLCGRIGHDLGGRRGQAWTTARRATATDCAGHFHQMLQNYKYILGSIAV